MKIIPFTIFFSKIDLSGIEANPDTVAAKIAHDTELTNRALLGYAKVDFLQLHVQFGHWNVRKVEQVEVKRVADSMKTGRGVIRYTLNTMVPLVVRKGQVDVSSLAKEPGSGADILPTLNILDDSSPIYAAGGQHRRFALELWKADLEKEVIALAGKLEAQDEDGRTELQKQLRSLKGELVGLGLWGVVVYDYGAQSLHRIKTHADHTSNRCLHC